MDLKLEGKVAIVTGSSQGIGFAIAERLAEEGCKVVLAARDKSRLDTAVADICARGCGQAIGHPTDVTVPEQSIALVEEAVKRFGTVHILVNNAGGGGHPFGFYDITEEDWIATLNLNLLSPVRLSKAVLPYMRAQKWGRIINISSAASIQPVTHYAHYSAAKAALNNFTKTMSAVVGRDGIMCNTVTPGLIRSPAFDSAIAAGGAARGLSREEAELAFTRKLRPGNVRGRAGDAAEVGSLVAFLASDLSGYITGTIHRIDGGATFAV